MYTQCPQCLTYFQVTPEHLKVAQGNVRCGQCRNVFSALGNLTEEPPQSALETADADIDDDIFIDESDELEEYEEVYLDDDQDYEEEYVESTSNASAQAGRGGAAGPNSPSKLSEAIAAIKALNQNSPYGSQPKSSNQPMATSENDAAARKFAFQPPPHVKPPAITSKQEQIPIAPAADDDISIDEALSAIDELDITGDDTMVAETEANTETLEEYIEEQYDEEEYIEEEYLEEAYDEEYEDEYYEEEYVEDEQYIELSSHEEKNTSPNSSDTSISNSVAAKAQHEPFIEEIQEEEPHLIAQEEAEFRDDLYINEHDLIKDDKTIDVAALQKTEKDAGVVKVKALERKADDTPKAAPKPKKPAPASAPAVDAEPVKHLPAIPSQLLEDFHPQNQQSAQHHFALTGWAIGSIGLMLVFLLQVVYFKHDDLGHVSTLRPVMEQFCKLMPCDLSLPTDVKRIELVSQDIRSHPKVKKALLVNTTIINNATFLQSYPGLQITFSDLNGQRVAMRRFRPHEYLAPSINIEGGMPPNTPIQVELEMMDPGSKAVNFEFDFFPLS
ncbi:zinc-ribbon and DUF3426 domain-containing protein [Kaarinaea lacus]